MLFTVCRPTVKLCTVKLVINAGSLIDAGRLRHVIYRLTYNI